MTDLPTDPTARAREVLSGYPQPAIDAAIEFGATHSPAALDSLVFKVLAFHLPKPESRSLDLGTFPGNTKLVADLSFDSLAIVEVNFLLTDLLNIQLADDELRALVTLDDLRLLLRKHLGFEPAA